MSGTRQALCACPHSCNVRRQAQPSPSYGWGLRLRETALAGVPELARSRLEAAVHVGLTFKPGFINTPTSPPSRVSCLEVPHARDAPYWSLGPLGSGPFPSNPLPHCCGHTEFLTLHTVACTALGLSSLANSYSSFRPQLKCHPSWATFLLLSQP